MLVADYYSWFENLFRVWLTSSLFVSLFDSHGSALRLLPVLSKHIPLQRTTCLNLSQRAVFCWDCCTFFLVYTNFHIFSAFRVLFLFMRCYSSPELLIKAMPSVNRRLPRYSQLSLIQNCSQSRPLKTSCEHAVNNIGDILSHCLTSFFVVNL